MPTTNSAAELVMDVHVLRRVRDIQQANGCRPPREIAERCEAAELRLRSMSALELAEALIKYRRVTGVPFKL